MNVLDAVYDWLSPIQDMDEEGFQAFLDGISTKSWSRILKIVNAIDAIDERETAEDKIIKLLHSKGLGVVGESFAEPITDATTFEGAKTTILFHWEQANKECRKTKYLSPLSNNQSYILC
jgi:hypothetical protein